MVAGSSTCLLRVSLNGKYYAVSVDVTKKPLKRLNRLNRPVGMDESSNLAKSCSSGDPCDCGTANTRHD